MMEWTRGPIIGRGASATVSLATTSSGDLFAVKSTALPNSTLLQKEQKILSSLNSPHVVHYRGFEITDQNYNLFIEYLPGGSLSDEINRRGGSIHESQIKFYSEGILKGLDYLHSNGIVHCDVKSDNVLIGSDGAKIADLGCARLVEKGGDAVVSGTPAFMSPEVARGGEQGFPADIWAVGCTVIEMATGSHPWKEMNDAVSVMYKIGFSGDVPELPEIGFSAPARDFVAKCLMKDPRERWTAKELLKHPFLVDYDDKVDEFDRNSPNCVLDFGVFWESPESPRNVTHMGCCSSSPAERIELLVEDDYDLMNWVENGDWIVVRDNVPIGEGFTVSEVNHKEVMETEDSVSSILELSGQEEEIGNAIVVDNGDLLFSDSSSVIEFGDSSVFTDLVIYCGETFSDSSLVECIFTFQRKLMEIIFWFNVLVVFLFVDVEIRNCYSFRHTLGRIFSSTIIVCKSH